MKKILLVAAVLFSMSATNSAQAQVSVHVGRPVVKEQWYSRDNSYYYLPEQGVYLSLIHISEPRDLSTSRMPSSA